MLVFLISLISMLYQRIFADKDIVMKPESQMSWTSQTFIIPVQHPTNSLPFVWTVCRRSSCFYCLDAFESFNEQELIAFTPIFQERNFRNKFYDFLTLNMIDECSEKMRPIFRYHNLFSDLDELCCYRQCFDYRFIGYRYMHLKVEEYISKLTNYSNADGNNKHINAIWSFYDPVSDANIITKLGFGEGRLRRFNHLTAVPRQRTGAPYLLKIGDQWSPKITYENPENFLTFNWFKFNIICKEQVWICK